MDFIQRMEKARRKQGVTCRELGRRVGLLGSDISELEHGGAILTHGERLRIAEALGISAEMRPLSTDISKGDE